METSLRTPIKELIERYPKTGEILDGFGIGCVPCSVGTCLLSDIVEIHDLSPEDEEKLMVGIAGIVSPGKKVNLPERKVRAAHVGKRSYSPPMQRLVDEHVLIKRFIALIPRMIETTDISSVEGKQLILDGVDFIRSYADRFHHAKEEDILFALFDRELDILKVMHEDHRRGRSSVRELIEAIERKDEAGAAAGLRKYSEILTEHIKKEDEILYPWMDRGLSTRQVGELFSAFRKIDEAFDEDRKKYESFVFNLEEILFAPSAEEAQ